MSTFKKKEKMILKWHHCPKIVPHVIANDRALAERWAKVLQNQCGLPGAPAKPWSGMLDESSEPLRTVTLRMYPGGPASPVSTTGLRGTRGTEGRPGCWGLDGCLAGCVLGCAGWPGP